MQSFKATSKILLPTFIFIFGFFHSILGQTGSIHEPVRYIGGVTIDPNVHEGRLRYATPEKPVGDNLREGIQGTYRTH